jgi:hypothetical protein
MKGQHTLGDWQYEVANGDTMRGYEDWLAVKLGRDPTPDLVAHAAREVIEAASRSGSRLCFGSGDEPDIWEEYMEVPQAKLDALKGALS